MSETSMPPSPSGWPGLLPPETLKEWRKIDPEFPGRLLTQIENDACHLRRMAWARLVAGVVLFAASLAVSALYVLHGAAPYGAASGLAGASVFAILLTGRPAVRTGR